MVERGPDEPATDEAPVAGRDATTEPDAPAGTGSWDDEADDGNIAGEFLPQMGVEPGDPALESALFVALGAVVGVLMLTRIFVDVDGFTLVELARLVGGTLLVVAIGLVYLGIVDVRRVVP